LSIVQSRIHRLFQEQPLFVLPKLPGIEPADINAGADLVAQVD
jgi:hypothetical protein